MRILISLVVLILPSILTAGDHDWPSIHQWPKIERPGRHILFFTQKPCPPCDQEIKIEFPKLEKEGFIIKPLGEISNVSVIDIRKYPGVAEKYEVDITPYFVMIDENGKEVSTRRVGYHTADQIKKWYRSSNPDDQVKRSQYPLRWKNWTGPDGRHQLSSREEAIQHLLNDGEHRGKFTRLQLDKLSLGELQALHSDDHEQRVNWSVLNN